MKITKEYIFIEGVKLHHMLAECDNMEKLKEVKQKVNDTIIDIHLAIKDKVFTEEFGNQGINILKDMLTQIEKVEKEGF